MNPGTTSSTDALETYTRHFKAHPDPLQAAIDTSLPATLLAAHLLGFLHDELGWPPDAMIQVFESDSLRESPVRHEQERRA